MMKYFAGSSGWPGPNNSPAKVRRRGAREGEHQALARRGMQPMLRRLTDDRGPEGIGDDEASVFRENLARHVERGREKQPVAVRPIVQPFLVGAEVGDRGFDLDDP